MNISKIFIAGYKYDIHWTRACVASIRYQYPDIPVFLIKDKLYGDYSTREIEKYWNVSVLETTIQKFGWGLSKLEPLFLPGRERVLIMDSDIVIVGKLLEWLNEYTANFIIRGQISDTEFTNTNYYNINKLSDFDEDYKFHGQGFCSGHLVATTGIFTRKDFNHLINWDDSPPSLKNPDIFRFGEQGMINYFLYKMQQTEKISIDSIPFMEIGDNPIVDQISVESIKYRTVKPLLIHWGGIRAPILSENANGDILHFFDDFYYKRLRLWGLIIRYIRPKKNAFIGYFKKSIKTIIGRS